MRFTETGLDGAVLVDLEPRADERGFFARAWCAEEFREAGLDPTVAQINLSTNERRGTLRGLHYQTGRNAEVKLMRCIRGAIWDVIVDMREDSSTYLRWVGAELTADNRRMLYVPAGFAHGYQALEDGAEVLYHASMPYAPGSEAGLRWDDSSVGIEWPIAPPIVSSKDAAWPDVAPASARPGRL